MLTFESSSVLGVANIGEKLVVSLCHSPWRVI
jgi:hypothetical protein